MCVRECGVRESVCCVCERERVCVCEMCVCVRESVSV